MNNKEFFKEYIEIFLNQNSVINLISKNDEKYIWEKHICDSLAFEKFLETYNVQTQNKKMLDIGTGGGFPAIPIAISHPEIKVYALDSIKKKINAIENIKTKLHLKNIYTICDRAENIKEKYDLITSRAVAPMKNILEYAMPLLKPNGYFIAYKSLKTDDEIKDAKSVLKKYKSEVDKIIKYDLPLKENHTRNLVIVKFCKV